MMHLQHLTVRRGRRVVLDGIDLTLNAGEFVGLLGPNGAGKTTLLRAALGLLPAEGHSSLAALPIAQRARAAAFLPQTRDIAWPMPVEDVVRLGRIAQGPDAAIVEQALAALDLAPLRHRPATQLSGGEQARVLIARALAQDGQVILLDEPFTGVDVKTEEQIVTLLGELRAEGRVMLVSTHNLGSVPEFCDRVVLVKGTVLAHGPTETTFTRDNLEAAFGGVLRHITLGGGLLHSDDDPRQISILTDDERPFVQYDGRTQVREKAE